MSRNGGFTCDNVPLHSGLPRSPIFARGDHAGTAIVPGPSWPFCPASPLSSRRSVAARPGLTGGGLPVTPSNISHSAPHSRRALRTSTSPADLKTLKRTAQNDAAIGRLEAHDSREGETKSNKHTTERPDAKHTKAISGSPKKKKFTELQPTLSVSVQISLKEEVLALRQARGVQSGTLRRQACRTLPRYYTRTIYP